MIANTAGRPVLFFDGVCNLCNSTVQFIIRHDKQQQFLFAPLQSAAGKEALAHMSTRYKRIPDSVILFYNDRYYVRSSAALHVLRLLGGGWSLLFAGIIFPPFLRDAVYNFISKNRYKWFGKQASCMLPTPELQDRFLVK